MYARRSCALLAAALLALTTAQPATARTADPAGVVTGKVSDDRAAAVAGVRVEVRTSDGDPVADTTTGADGTYRVEAPPGAYLVRFKLGAAEQWAPRKRDYDDAGVYTVKADATLTLHEKLLPFGYLGGRLADAQVDTAGRVEVS
ncbi:MAG TPA: carboxypeptidase-like regulatory domain-containing protein, partial [Pilimelia sp.]|nr:carboxypeptidase-like regulatory domain-containing protein [Pilimelia sp.]